MDDPSSTNAFQSYTSLPTISKDLVHCRRIVGQGGFGIVYKGEHTNWGDVAIKVCNKSISEDAKKQVRREIERMVKAGAHDNVVQIRGIIQNLSGNVDCCIVIEFMKYGSLKTFQGRLSSFPPACKVNMIYDVIKGMNFLHTKGIFHRDLKLENIFVGRGFIAKVGDLGLATWCTASDYKYPAGTISHIAPENYANMPKPTKKSDMYSFGITLWEFVTERQPYEYAANNAHIERHVEKGNRPDTSPDFISSKYEPSILVEMMKRAWDPEPDKRPTFQDLKEWIGKEYTLKYEKDIDLYLSELSKQVQEELGKECCKFPWEETADMPDSPMDHQYHFNDHLNDDKARAEDAQPRSLHSLGGPDVTMETVKMVVDKHPVSVTDKTEGTLPGLSKITAGMAATGISTQPQGDRDGDCKTLPSEYPLIKPERERVFCNPRQESHPIEYNLPVEATPDDPTIRMPTNPTSHAGTHVNVCGDGHTVIVAEQCISVKVMSPKKKNKSKRTDSTPSSSSSSSDTSRDDDDLKAVDAVPYITTSTERVTEQDISKLDRHIGGKWKKLGRKLCLMAVTIDNIKADYYIDGQQEMAFQVMLAWKREQSNPTKGKLAQALMDVGLNEVAQML